MASRVHMPLADLVLRASTGNGSGFSTNRASGLMSFILNATADTAGTTLDVIIEALDPNSGSWFEVVAFTQIGATTPSSERITVPGIPENTIRAAWVIVGTNYTFSVSGFGLQI